MTLAQLRIIATLVNSDYNVSVTADKLCRVQSAISNQLRMLEEELGGDLFERRGKRLVGPTLLCEKLLPEIEKLLHAEQNLKLITQEYTDESRGELRIATTHTQARYFLPEVIETFKACYPQVKLTFNLENPSRFPDLLRQREIDIAVFAEEFPAFSDLVEAECYQWNRALVVRADHPLADAVDLSLEKIADCPIVTYMPGFADRNLIEKTFEDEGLVPDITCSAGDTDVIKTYVRLNLGIGIVAQMAQALETDDDLVFRSLSHLFGNSATRVVYLGACELRKYMQEFIRISCEHGRVFEKQLRV